MKLNVGTVDRVVRLVVAAAAIYVGLVSPGILKYVGFSAAGVMLVTALAGFCPLYTLFGINTCPVKRV